MPGDAKILVLCPLLIPFVTGIVTLLVWGHRRTARAISLVGAGALMVAAVVLLVQVSRHGIQVVQAGGWPAPFGITLAVDLFSAIMIVLGAMMGLSVVIYSLASMDERRESFGYYPLLHFLLMGVSGSFLTGDLFNLYVWFEVMLISSFVLLALGGRPSQLEGSIKYVTLNLLSSALFLAGLGILYAMVGTLNMADLSVQLAASPRRALVTSVAVLFMVAFGIKAAVFPLFFWLPASYHTPPAAVSAIFAGLLTKVGVYALIRVFTLLFLRDPQYTHGIILVLAGFTMLSGVLGAMVQNEFRRILSFHIVSQIGYMIMGLGLAGVLMKPNGEAVEPAVRAIQVLALGGSIFYLIHHIIVKTNLFLVSGLVARLQGSYQLKQLGGVMRSYPVVGILFLIPAMSLAGVPPLSGFWAKFTLVRAGLAMDRWLIVGVALLVSLMTLYSMTKIWNEVFWKNNPSEEGFARPALGRVRMRWGGWTFYLIPIVGLALCTVLIGLFGEPIVHLAMRAAEQLLDPSQYIQTVLGGSAL